MTLHGYTDRNARPVAATRCPVDCLLSLPPHRLASLFFSLTARLRRPRYDFCSLVTMKLANFPALSGPLPNFALSECRKTLETYDDRLESHTDNAYWFIAVGLQSGLALQSLKRQPEQVHPQPLDVMAASSALAT